MKAIIVAACLLVGLLLYDCIGGRTEHVTAVIVGKEYMPGHWSYGTDSKGKSTSHYTPADYTLIVEDRGNIHRLDTNERGYYTTHEGQSIRYDQRRGCLSHTAWMASYYR